MDIIIRNGVIDSFENKRLHKIKNEEKINFENYNINVPGPYYDMLDSHICIPRYYNQIKNFNGPQSSKRKKLLDIKDFNTKCKYCCICHQEIKRNKSLISDKIFVEDDSLERKKRPLSDNYDNVFINELSNTFNTFTIDKNNNMKFQNLSNSSIDGNITNTFSKMEIKNKKNEKKWKNLFNIIYRRFISRNLIIYKKTIFRIYKNYYKLVYKLLYKPIYYPISLTETKILWPWELTNYQKLRLKEKNYKDSCIFFKCNNKFSTNYVTIE